MPKLDLIYIRKVVYPNIPIPLYAYMGKTRYNYNLSSVKDNYLRGSSITFTRYYMHDVIRMMDEIARTHSVGTISIPSGVVTDDATQVDVGTYTLTINTNGWVFYSSSVNVEGASMLQPIGVSFDVNDNISVDWNITVLSSCLPTLYVNGGTVSINIAFDSDISTTYGRYADFDSCLTINTTDDTEVVIDKAYRGKYTADETMYFGPKILTGTRVGTGRHLYSCTKNSSYFFSIISYIKEAVLSNIARSDDIAIDYKPSNVCWPVVHCYDPNYAFELTSDMSDSERTDTVMNMISLIIYVYLNAFFYAYTNGIASKDFNSGGSDTAKSLFSTLRLTSRKVSTYGMRICNALNVVGSYQTLTYNYLANSLYFTLQTLFDTLSMVTGRYTVSGGIRIPDYNETKLNTIYMSMVQNMSSTINSGTLPTLDTIKALLMANVGTYVLTDSGILLSEYITNKVSGAYTYSIYDFTTSIVTPDIIDTEISNYNVRNNMASTNMISNRQKS